MTTTPKPLYSLKRLILPMIFVTALFWVTLSRKPVVSTYYGQAMGTTWSVVIPSTEKNKQDLQQIIQQELNNVNMLMSTYHPDSEISRFNRHDTTVFDISTETALVIKTGLKLSSKTNGAFDITIGPAVNSWGFGFPPSLQQPSTDQLRSLAEYVGYDLLELHGNSIRKIHTNTQIDLSAIAKGFAVDQVVRSLNNMGYSNFLVEVGGEIFTRGVNGEKAWIVGVEQPSETEIGIQISFPLMDKALATSGDYRNYKEVNGQRYSHTINPRSLRPIEHNVASISVITDSVMMADAWATALNVMGEDEAFRVAEEYDLAIYMLIRESDGTFLTLESQY